MRWTNCRVNENLERTARQTNRQAGYSVEESEINRIRSYDDNNRVLALNYRA